jgi:SapC
MTNSVLLNNVTHKDLRVKTGYSAEFGDSINSCLVFPTEFAYVQREYPIVFRRDAQGDLQPIALLGFDENENLFLDEKGWNARYVPAIQQRGPFMIGLQKGDIADERREAMVNVDLDHPRISRAEGEPVFLPQGGNSPYLEHMSRVLQLIHKGAGVIRPMIAAFEEAGLIESVDVNVELRRGPTFRLAGLLTVGQEKLSGLNGARLERLNSAGFLQLAVLAMASVGNISWLVELKNRKRAAA